MLTREDVEMYPLIRNRIPEEVKYIDDHCFRNNTDYKEIILHDGIQDINDTCFMNCSARIVIDDQ